MRNKRKLSVLVSIFAVSSILMQLTISAGEITLNPEEEIVTSNLEEVLVDTQEPVDDSTELPVELIEPVNAIEEPVIEIIEQSENASISLDKTVSNENPAPGDKVTYSYKVKNTGEVAFELKNITIEDPILETLGISVEIEETSDQLEPGQDYTFITTEYTVKSEDAGKTFTSAAKAVATIDNVEENITSDEDSATFTVKTLDLSVAVTVDKVEAFVGDTLTYTIKVENSGQTDLKDIIVKDDLVTDLTPSDKFDLKAGESKPLTATYVVKEEDKVVTNEVSATGKDPNENGVNSNSSCVATTIKEKPIEYIRSLKLEKTINNECPIPGEIVTYTFKVTNTGNITLKNIKIDDPMIDETAFEPQCVVSLAAGESTTFTAKYTVPEDAKPGTKTTNVAIAVGECEKKETIKSNESCATFTVAAKAAKPSLSISKTVNNTKPQKGNTVIYTIKVTNTGNVPIFNVKIEDEALGYCKVIDKLDVGKYAKVEISKTVKEDVGKVFTNTAKATVEGLDPVSSSVSYTVVGDPLIYLPSTGEKTFFIFNILK